MPGAKVHQFETRLVLEGFIRFFLQGDLRLLLYFFLVVAAKIRWVARVRAGEDAGLKPTATNAGFAALFGLLEIEAAPGSSGSRCDLAVVLAGCVWIAAGGATQLAAIASGLRPG